MGSEDTPEKLILQTECQSIGQGLEEQIASFLYNRSDTGLVVIDTLQKVRSCDQSGSIGKGISSALIPTASMQ